ncbi:LamB/YcsF family protein [Rhizobium sp. AG207R]|uniref:LamB/YcsF family protein n=1 Tax=Rhizobium sp. AG207R TaxID=2802287 RepID=UPI0022ABFA51|nr:5-oxoprolinase subunit PxpA [Rhizobium sp. AG207R]MCZ3378416.1 LamB/YcsF family protein [Rhizobium sp. AG207R]
MPNSIDLNSDLGEGFGPYTFGSDEAMLSIVTSANIACGLHAGDPEIMAQTFALAADRGVSIGAHPGFPDLWGFGRRRIPFSTGEVERLIAYQIGAAAGIAALTGKRLSYVKTHGALANIAAEERSVADAIARAVRAVDPALALLATALTEQVRAGDAAGLQVYQEIYADRGYDQRGQLIPRGHPGALIEDIDFAARRALEMVERGAIVTDAGEALVTPIDSICVHGDSPHAVELAKRVRAVMQGAGVTLESFSS